MAKVQLHCSPDQPFFAIAVNKSFTRITLPLTTVCKIATTANLMSIENYLSGFCPFGLSTYSLFYVSNTFWNFTKPAFWNFTKPTVGIFGCSTPEDVSRF